MDKDELGRYEIEGFYEGGKNSKPLKLKVTFPSGKVICYTIVEKTFIEALKEIGSDKFDQITVERGHLPILSKTIHAKFAGFDLARCFYSFLFKNANFPISVAILAGFLYFPIAIALGASHLHFA